jgi:hypothetical protein
MPYFWQIRAIVWTLTVKCRWKKKKDKICFIFQNCSIKLRFAKVLLDLSRTHLEYVACCKSRVLSLLCHWRHCVWKCWLTDTVKLDLVLIITQQSHTNHSDSLTQGNCCGEKRNKKYYETIPIKPLIHRIDKNKGKGTLLHGGYLYFCFRLNWSKLCTVIHYGPNIINMQKKKKFSINGPFRALDMCFLRYIFNVFKRTLYNH